MNAISEDAIVDGPHDTIKVLFTLHPGVELLELSGPLTVLQGARHKSGDPDAKAFACLCVSTTKGVQTAQGTAIAADMDYKEAYKRLREIDVLVVPGGNPDDILKDGAEPIPLIRAFGEMQKNNPERERTLMSISTGSLFLAKAGVLQGFTATTHPNADIRLEKLCQEASAHVSTERTDVMQERYIVNNGRFDLGDIDENPFVVDRRGLDEIVLSHKQRRRSSIARKGSNSWKESNIRQEPHARRANLRLGGLRVITSNAGSSGMDASLYLVCAMVNDDAAQEVAGNLGYEWQKGVVVNALDV